MACPTELRAKRPATLSIIIRTRPDARFRLRGSDLWHAKRSKLRPLCLVQLDVPTLGGSYRSPSWSERSRILFCGLHNEKVCRNLEERPRGGLSVQGFPMPTKQDLLSVTTKASEEGYGLHPLQKDNV
jgi:hypothetical protein